MFDLLGQLIVRETGGVHHNVVVAVPEVLQDEVQGMAVGLFRGRRAGQDVQARGVLGHDAAQVGGVQAGDVLGQVRPGVFKGKIQEIVGLAGRAAQVHECGPAGRAIVQDAGQVHGQGGGPQAGLGAEHGKYLALVALVLAQAGAHGRAHDGRAEVVLFQGVLEKLADAAAHGPDQNVRVGVVAGKVDVFGLARFQGLDDVRQVLFHVGTRLVDEHAHLVGLLVREPDHGAGRDHLLEALLLSLVADSQRDRYNSVVHWFPLVPIRPI